MESKFRTLEAFGGVGGCAAGREGGFPFFLSFFPSSFIVFCNFVKILILNYRLGYLTEIVCKPQVNQDIKKARVHV